MVLYVLVAVSVFDISKLRLLFVDNSRDSELEHGSRSRNC